MIKLDDIPQNLRRKKDSWKAIRDEWLEYGDESLQKMYSDVDGTHTPYTKKQLEKIDLRTKITASINQLYPILLQKLAYLIEEVPSHKIISTNGKNKEIAQILDRMKYTVLYDSKSFLQTEEVIKEMLAYGMGHRFNSDEDNYLNVFGVTSKHLPNEYVILDPNVRDKSFPNNQFFLEKEITIEDCEKYYGDIIAELPPKNDGTRYTAKDFSGNYDVSNSSLIALDETVNTVIVTEWWSPKKATMYLIENKDGTISREFKENYIEEAEILKGFEGIQKENQIEGFYYERHLWLGYKQIDITIKPQEYSPLTTYVYEWGGRPYQTYGMIHFNLGIQEAIDKLIQLFILNGILSNNPSYKWPQGAVTEDQIDNWTIHANNPLIPKEYVPQVVEGQVFIPEKEKVEPMSSFFPTILQMLKEAGEYIPGINPLIGDAKSIGIETSSTLSQYQETAYKKVKLALKRILAAEENNGNSLIELLIEHIDINKNYPYFNDEDEDIKELTVVTEQIQTMKRTRYYLMTIPWKGDSSQRRNMASEFMKIAQTATDANERSLFVHEAIKMDELRGSKKLLEKLDVVKNTQAQLSNMQEQMKRMEELMKQMENKYIQSKQDLRIADSVISQLTKMAKAEGAFTELIKQQKSKIEGENSGN